MKPRTFLIAPLLAASLTLGAAHITAAAALPAAPFHAAEDELPENLFLKTPPADALTIAAAREKARPGDTVTLRGRILTGKSAFTQGQAVFTIAAAEALTPKPNAAGLAPPKPADTATVRILAGDRPIAVDLKARTGLRPGSDVIVTGRLAAAADNQPLTIDAAGIYIVPTGLPENFFLESEPAGAKVVEEVKKTAKEGDTVTIQGRIGGSVYPFVENRAVFTIVGPGLLACSDREDDHCKTPWDYCCDPRDEILRHSATIQVTDAAGKPLKVGLKGQAGLKELSTVTVVGKVTHAGEKALIITATAMHVK